MNDTAGEKEDREDATNTEEVGKTLSHILYPLTRSVSLLLSALTDPFVSLCLDPLALIILHIPGTERSCGCKRRPQRTCLQHARDA
jgi:hypothetical protein